MLTQNQARHIANLVWVENKPGRATIMLAELEKISPVEANKILMHDAPSEEALFQKLRDRFVETPKDRLARLINERSKIEREIIEASDELAIEDPATHNVYIAALKTDASLETAKAREIVEKWYESQRASGEISVMPLESIDDRMKKILIRLPADQPYMWPGLKRFPAMLTDFRVDLDNPETQPYFELTCEINPLFLDGEGL